MTPPPELLAWLEPLEFQHRSKVVLPLTPTRAFQTWRTIERVDPPCHEPLDRATLLQPSLPTSAILPKFPFFLVFDSRFLTIVVPLVLYLFIMKFPYFLIVLATFTHQTNAVLDFIDAITSDTGTTALDFSGLQFNQPFTIGWIDGSSAVNISVWIKNADESSTFLETIESNLAPSGSIAWTPTKDDILPEATAFPPKNNNIIGARSESASDMKMSLMPHMAYRLTISDDTTTVFSPSFAIADMLSGKKNGLTKMAIVGIVIACVVAVLAAAGVAAFILYRKKTRGQAERREILKRKINMNGSAVSV